MTFRRKRLVAGPEQFVVTGTFIITWFVEVSEKKFQFHIIFLLRFKRTKPFRCRGRGRVTVVKNTPGYIVSCSSIKDALARGSDCGSRVRPTRKRMGTPQLQRPYQPSQTYGHLTRPPRDISIQGQSKPTQLSVLTDSVTPTKHRSPVGSIPSSMSPTGIPVLDVPLLETPAV